MVAPSSGNVCSITGAVLSILKLTAFVAIVWPSALTIILWFPSCIFVEGTIADHPSQLVQNKV